MAYKVIILYRLYMPSYFLGTFTEYPYIKHPKTNFQHLKLRFFLPKVCTIKNIAYLCNRKLKEIGAIAQLVEQRTENPCVPGSIPGGTTLKKSKRQ